MENPVEQGAVTEPVPTVNPQCKVCKSTDRFEIEVALAERQSRELIAQRFSRNGQTFSRQNMHSHYHNHMAVVDRAVAEAAAARLRNRILDVGTATEIDVRNERNLALMREQLSVQIEENGLRWSPKDAMSFMQMDVLLSEKRSAAQLEGIMVEARAFAAAVKEVVPQAMWADVVQRYDSLVDGDVSDLLDTSPTIGSSDGPEDACLDEAGSV